VANLKLISDLIANSDEDGMKLNLLNKYPSVIEALDQTISGLVKVLSIEKDPGSTAKETRFREICDEVYAELDSMIANADPEIITDFSACETIVFMQSYLKSIFRNLISNAIKYRDESRKLSLEIRSHKLDNFILLTFRDNGTGIDLDAYGHDLFKPFKRFSRLSEGSGLGLHLIKGIVTKNGGKIEVSSKAGEGTVFSVYLVPYTV
jgi:signal transduction histidine kinase